MGALYTKVKEGSGQEITELLEEGRKSWQEITIVGVKTAPACIGRLTIAWKENSTMAFLVLVSTTALIRSGCGGMMINCSCS